MSKWRLVSDVAALFPISSRYDVFLICIDNKKVESEVSKMIKEIYNNDDGYIKRIVDNELDIRISSTGLQVRCDGFLEESSWYNIVNANYDQFFSIITQVKNNLGSFDDTFEAIFSDSCNTCVGFINDTMKEYTECLEEMGRRVICDTSKKTKKRIVGHRYDSENRSLYYLGNVLTNKTATGLFSKDTNICTLVNLYTTKVNNGEKTVSDIFKNHVFNGNDIIVINTDEDKSLVDFGKVLDDDTNNIEDYWDYIFNNMKNYFKDNYGKILYILYYISPKYIIENNLSSEIESIIKDSLKDLIKKNWNINNNFNHELEIKSSNSDEVNERGLKNLFFSRLVDSNLNKKRYYTDLFNEINIDIDKDITEALSDWKNFDIHKDWDTFVEYSQFLGKSYKFDQRTKEVISISITKTKLEDVFPENLKNVIISMVYEANKDFGLHVSKYAETNTGTKKDPRVFTDITIKLKDLCNSGKLDDKIKKEIMNLDIKEINILCNQGGKLE